MNCAICTGHVEFDDAAILPEGWAHRECVDPPIAADVPPEGAIPVEVRYGRQGGFEIMPNDLPKPWVRDSPDEWIPAYLVKRNPNDGGTT